MLVLSSTQRAYVIKYFPFASMCFWSGPH